MPSATSQIEQYHRGELAIALDPAHPGHILPDPVPPGDRVLDIGCGAGQTLIAAFPDRITFGLDIDHGALVLGEHTLAREHGGRIRFVRGRAEQLPWPDASFDFVMARVALSYTDLTRSLPEARRVLRPGGKLWLTLHPFRIVWDEWKPASLRSGVYFAYVLANSALFHFFGRQVRFLRRYESFQTEGGARRALERCGFERIQTSHGRHFVVRGIVSK